MLDRRISFLACSLLGVATAHAQVASPAPAQPPAPVAPAPAPVAPAPALSAPPAGAPAVITPSAPVAPSLDPALMQRSAEAKASGQLLDIANPATVAGCRDLGSDAAESDLEGIRGRGRIRIELRSTARTRGASHVLYSDYHSGNVQTERGRFFDCSGEAPLPGSAPIGSATGGAAAPAGPPAPRMGSISVQLDLLPTGSLGTKVNGQSMSVDTEMAFGLTGGLEYYPTPSISLGLAPGLVFGLKGDGASSSATQLDLRGRLRFGQLARDAFAVNGYVTIGGSWIYLPDDGGTSSGGTFGLGVGASYPVSRDAFLMFDVGYQIGGQSVTVAGTDFELSSNLLHFGIGFGSYL